MTPARYELPSINGVAVQGRRAGKTGGALAAAASISLRTSSEGREVPPLLVVT